MATAKANPDDLVHEPSPLYVVSERTLRALAEGSVGFDEVLAALRQDNYTEVEVLTEDDRAKINLLQPPF